MTPSSEEIVEHLASCFDALYRSLGETAPHMTNDAYVVRCHEMGRAFGEVAVALRAVADAPAKPFTLIEAVVRHALVYDETGAMTLYAVAMEVGPRLLVSVRDAREALGDEEYAKGLLDHAAQVMVREILAVGEVAKGQAPIEDSSWQSAARDLADTLDGAGNAESFGISR